MGKQKTVRFPPRQHKLLGYPLIEGQGNSLYRNIKIKGTHVIRTDRQCNPSREWESRVSRETSRKVRLFCTKITKELAWENEGRERGGLWDNMKNSGTQRQGAYYFPRFIGNGEAKIGGHSQPEKTGSPERVRMQDEPTPMAKGGVVERNLFWS